jgi:prolyl oligopeptidase
LAWSGCEVTIHTFFAACRVVPLHTFKLIAELQYALALAPGAASKQRNPLVVRIEVRAGHGAGKPTTKIIQETSDLMAFAAKCMGAKWMEAKL